MREKGVTAKSPTMWYFLSVLDLDIDSRSLAALVTLKLELSRQYITTRTEGSSSNRCLASFGSTDSTDVLEMAHPLLSMEAVLMPMSVKAWCSLVQLLPPISNATTESFADFVDVVDR